MAGGWRYRLLAVTGTVGLAALTILVANSTWTQSLAAMVPIFSRLSANPAVSDAEVVFEVVTGTAVVTAAFVPLYKPRSRRILDTITLSVRRLALAVTVLATIGYFDYTFRLPRLTLLVVAPILLVGLPAWLAALRRRSADVASRAVAVGAAPDQRATIAVSPEPSAVGCVPPPTVTRACAGRTA